MSNLAQAEFIGVIRENAGNNGQTLLASVFSNKTSLDKSGVERGLIELCSKEKGSATFKNKSSVNDSTHLYVIFNPNTQCFIGCAANVEFAERLAWDVLRDAQAEIIKIKPDDVASTKPLGLNRTLREPLLAAMAGGKDDKLAIAQGKIDDTKVQMQGNMEKMVQNYDNLQDLEKQCDDLEFESKQYQKEATKFKWQSLKQYWWAIAAVISVILIIIIILLVKYC